MTIAPHTVGADVTVEAARRMMIDFEVRHLPVRSDGRLVGIVSSADLTRLPGHLTVLEVMNRTPLVVSARDSAADVAIAMCDRRSDAAIVVRGDRVIGIFTATDATRALATTLHALEERR